MCRRTTCALYAALLLAACGEPDAGERPGTGSYEPSASEFVCKTPAFEACGGDVLGTWSYAEFCPVGAAEAIKAEVSQGRFGCEDTEVDVDYSDVTGWITFSETTIQRSLHFVEDVTLTMDDDCLQGIAGDPAADPLVVCVDIGDNHGDGTFAQWGCATVPEGCTCKGTAIADQQTSPVAYEVAGNTLQSVDYMGSIPYCVRGNRLIMHWVPPTGSALYEWYLVFERFK